MTREEDQTIIGNPDQTLKSEAQIGQDFTKAAASLAAELASILNHAGYSEDRRAVLDESAPPAQSPDEPINP